MRGNEKLHIYVTTEDMKRDSIPFNCLQASDGTRLQIDMYRRK
jgi:hypothetical protein